jgi:hypothetical protein
MKLFERVPELLQNVLEMQPNLLKEVQRLFFDDGTARHLPAFHGGTGALDAAGLMGAVLTDDQHAHGSYTGNISGAARGAAVGVEGLQGGAGAAGVAGNDEDEDGEGGEGADTFTFKTFDAAGAMPSSRAGTNRATILIQQGHVPTSTTNTRKAVRQSLLKLGGGGLGQVPGKGSRREK